MRKHSKLIFLLVLAIVLGGMPACDNGSSDSDERKVVRVVVNAANVVTDTVVDLVEGDEVEISVDPDQIWSAGSDEPFSRKSNADGISPELYAQLDREGFTFNFGALVGKIGAGKYFLIGTHFVGTVSEPGRLSLYYWDDWFPDNSGQVEVEISATLHPEIEECKRLLEEYRQKHREYLEFAGAIDFAQRFDEVNEAIKMVKEAMEATKEDTSSFAENADKLGKLLNKVDRSNKNLKQFLEGVSGGLESSSNLMGEMNEALGKIDTAMGILEPLVHSQEASPSEVLEEFANYFEKVTEVIGPLVEGIPVLGVFLDIYINGIRACAQSAEQIERVVEERNRIYEKVKGGEDLYIRPKTPQQQQLEKKLKMEEELEVLAKKLWEECDIDVYEEEEEKAPQSVYDDIDKAAEEAYRQCAAQYQAYDDALKVEYDLRQRERDQSAKWEDWKRSLEEIQPAYDELMRLRTELQPLLSVVYQSGMTDEEKREVQEKLNRRHALESYIIPDQERKVVDYEAIKSEHDKALAAMEETRGKIPAATDMRMRSREEWIRCQREYLLEQARRNEWTERDLHVDHGHLFR